MLYFCGVALLVAVLRVSAQPPLYNPLGHPVYNDPGDQYVTVDVWESCTDTASATDYVTATVTATTCPLCQTHRTTWKTVWPTLCETGMADVTYTITETCTGPTPTWSHGPTYVPPGYTITTTVCTVCNTDNSPTVVTMTVPCDATPTPTWAPPPPGHPWQPGPPNPGPPNPGPPNPPPVQQTHGATTTTVTTCNGGTTMCPQTSKTTSTITNSHTTTMSHQSILPYSGSTGAAAPAATHLGGLIGGGIAALGVLLL